MGIVSLRSGEDTMVRQSVCHLFADVDCGSINICKSRAAHKTIKKGRVRILIDLLNSSGELGCSVASNCDSPSL